MKSHIFFLLENLFVGFLLSFCGWFFFFFSNWTRHEFSSLPGITHRQPLVVCCSTNVVHFSHRPQLWVLTPPLPWMVCFDMDMVHDISICCFHHVPHPWNKTLPILWAVYCSTGEVYIHHLHHLYLNTHPLMGEAHSFKTKKPYLWDS